MNTCPNCGAAVKPSDTFCQNCGYKLTQATTSTQPQPVTPTTTSAATRTVRKRHPHRKLRWISAIIVLAAVAVFYFYGTSAYSKTKQVDSMVSTLESHNGGSAAKFMTTKDPSLDINASALKPFMTYITQNKAYLAQMKSALSKNDQTNDGTFKLVKDGHHLLFFPRYKLEVTAMYPTVSTNEDGASISLNGVNVATAKNDDYTYKAGPLFPGRYTFKMKDDENNRSVVANLVSTQVKNAKVDLSVENDAVTSDNTTDTANATDSSDTTTAPEPNDGNHNNSGDTSDYGLFEEEYKGDEQAGIDAVSFQYGFDYDDYTYKLSWPHTDVLQVEAYDKDSHDYDGTYRYDQIHDIASELDEDTGKFETGD